VEAFKKREENEGNPTQPSAEPAMNGQYSLNPEAHTEPEDDSGSPPIEKSTFPGKLAGASDQNRS
jgi:hypothetical protein